MTSLTHPPGTARHRVDRRATHTRTDRFRAALRAAPVGRGQAVLLGYVAGLLTSGSAVAITYWIGAA